MSPRLRDLPAAVLCLATALARGEHAELLQIAQLVRGLAIQVALRWATRELLVDPAHATLLYSRLDKPRAGFVRTSSSVVVASLVGLTLFLISNTLLMLPISAVLRAFGQGIETTATVAVCIATARLTSTALRAIRTYRLERRQQRSMHRVEDRPRWRLDYIGATPAGSGHGGRLLREFVARSDAAGATVFLVTEPHNQGFYRRGGFRVVPISGAAFDGMVLMRRIAPTPRPRLLQQRVPAHRSASVVR